MEQIHPAYSEVGRPSFLRVVNHLGQTLASVIFPIDLLALLKHLYSNCAFTIKNVNNRVVHVKRNLAQNRVSPGIS